MTARYIFGRKQKTGEMPLPASAALDTLTRWVMAGHVLIPLVNTEDPLGIPPRNVAHFSRQGQQIKEGDRPPLEAVDSPFKALFLSRVNYYGYANDFAYHSGIQLIREGADEKIVGYDCYVSDPLKDALRQNAQAETFVVAVEQTKEAGFWRKEPEGQGHGLYARAGAPLSQVGMVAITPNVFGPDLLSQAQDPITDDTIRGFYKSMGARAADIAAYETTLNL